MNMMSIKKLIPLELKTHVAAYIGAKEYPLPTGRRCFVFLAADYGNIGDIAISHAQQQYLENVLSEYKIISVPISQTRFVIGSIKQQIKAEDIVTIIGGGNMGGSYPDIEALRQLVIKSFPNNRIVCFPQTLDWNESTQSRRALRHIVQVYAAHPNIYVFARESVTAAKLNELFSQYTNIHIGLVPDIVMSATADSLGATDRLAFSGILRCLRDDKEAALSAEQYRLIDSALEKTGYSITQTDTHAGGSQLDEAYCSTLLTDKLNQFRAAKLVITDRLHGMILCLLSGTPCLVLPNANHKIRQTQLDWLQAHPRIVFLELNEIGNISTFIDSLLSVPHGRMVESPVDSHQYADLTRSLTGL